MPIYDYCCQACGKEEERLVRLEARDLQSCHNCGAKLTRKLTTFNWKWYNPFTKDGEGFTSVKYPVKEADIRAKYNVPKGVSV